MSAAAQGALVRLTYDGPTVEPGDYLRTTSTGRLYLVQTVRRQDRGRNIGRQYLGCVVMGSDHVPEAGARVRSLSWYSRNRRRR